MNKLKEIQQERSQKNSLVDMNSSKISKLNKIDSGFSEMTNSSMNTVNSYKNSMNANSGLIKQSPMESNEENVRCSSESAVNLIDETDPRNNKAVKNKRNKVGSSYANMSKLTDIDSTA